jgi:cholesterol transport system auxiliary component
MTRTRSDPLHRTGRVCVLLSCLVLGACAALPDKPVRAVVYDFGPGARTNRATPPAVSAQPAVQLGEVHAASALDSTALLYRLAYADAQLLQPYAQARWSMPPAQLLRQRLREALGQQQAVLREGDGLRVGTQAARLLQLELDEFSQVFDGPGASVGLVRVHASVMASAGGARQLLAQRSFVAQQPAPSPDAAGGVRALTAASDQVLTDIAQWLNTLQ